MAQTEELTRLASMRRTLNTIADDMRDDAERFDGMPFNGRTVAEYFGNQGAAIAALANIIEEILRGHEPLAKA